jgi:hypothetical protein
MKKWVFYNKKSLTQQEVTYWTNNLKKILKIGIEFEFNLPTQAGTCRENNPLCVCMNLKNHCNSICINDNCSIGQNSSKCPHEFCTEFIQKCIVCKDYKINCSSCKSRYDAKKNPKEIRKSLRNKFKPTHNYGKLNKSGIHSITTDGSLKGDKGAEIITTGRRLDFVEFYKMISSVIKTARKNNAYVDERCSIHAHLLTSYYNDDSVSNELEKTMPQIIMLNFHQLLRRYQNVLTWISSGLDDINHFTRWEKYRVSILNTSAVLYSMPEIINIMCNKTGKRNGKYGFINYMFSTFDRVNDIKRFHVELRVLDGLLSESAVTSIICVLYALLIKSVELSRYGLLKVGDENWLQKATEIKENILNNTGSWDGPRTSSTSLTSKDIENIKKDGYELTTQIKHILFSIGPVYDTLNKLIEKPCAFRLIDGDTWDTIENDLKEYEDIESPLEYDIKLIINTVSCKATSEKKWMTLLSTLLPKYNEEDITNFIKNKKNIGKYVWAQKIQSMIIL